MHVLPVEDEREVVSFIRQGLQEEGYTVEVAGDGLTAADPALNTSTSDPIVLDTILLGNSGKQNSTTSSSASSLPTVAPACTRLCASIRRAPTRQGTQSANPNAIAHAQTVLRIAKALGLLRV